MADCLLLVPPLVHTYRPALGVHLLQARARQAGHRVDVAYPAIQYAGAVGEGVYADLCDAPLYWFVGERLFARAAYGIDALAPGHERFWREVSAYNDAVGVWTEEVGAPGAVGATYEPEALRRLRSAGEAVVEAVADEVAGRYDVVGASTTYDQTAPAIALLRAIKQRAPETVTVLGGRNCDGPMAHGVAGLSDHVDHVFSGEAEHAFTAFLDGQRDAPVVTCGLVTDLDALPLPDFAEWLAALQRWLPGSETPLWLNYEASRGCWWGAKQHCRFCGLIGTGMTDRARSPDRVLDDLRALTEATGVKQVNMTDNILPHGYHRTVIPRLPTEVPGLRVFWEIKANLDLDRVEALAAANIDIQPGIESLSTPVLDLMKKGQRARQCLDLLRHARATGLKVTWNLLFGFPGEERAWYEETLAMLPRLRHLPPPVGYGPLSLQRFSPYYEDAAQFGITDVRPRAAYADFLPTHADAGAVAYYFEGEWASAMLDSPELVREIAAEIAHWREAWRSSPPTLHLAPAGPGQWVLSDSRDVANVLYLSDDQARAVVHGRGSDTANAWAVRNGFALALDGSVAPLATAAPAVVRTLA